MHTHDSWVLLTSCHVRIAHGLSDGGRGRGRGKREEVRTSESLAKQNMHPPERHSKLPGSSQKHYRNLTVSGVNMPEGNIPETTNNTGNSIPHDWTPTEIPGISTERSTETQQIATGHKQNMTWNSTDPDAKLNKTSLETEPTSRDTQRKVTGNWTEHHMKHNKTWRESQHWKLNRTWHETQQIVIWNST